MLMSRGSMVKNVPCHINMDTHALTRRLLELNSQGNTAPYFLSPLFPFPNIIHLECVCVRAYVCFCVLNVCTIVCLCNTIDLSFCTWVYTRVWTYPCGPMRVYFFSNAITVVLIGLRHPMPCCIIRLNSRLICAHDFGLLSSLQPLLTLAVML